MRAFPWICSSPDSIIYNGPAPLILIWSLSTYPTMVLLHLSYHGPYPLILQWSCSNYPTMVLLHLLDDASSSSPRSKSLWKNIFCSHYLWITSVGGWVIWFVLSRFSPHPFCSLLLLYPYAVWPSRQVPSVCPPPPPVLPPPRTLQYGTYFS